MQIKNVVEIIHLSSSSECDLVAVINVCELVSHLLKRGQQYLLQLLTSGLENYMRKHENTLENVKISSVTCGQFTPHIF